MGELKCMYNPQYFEAMCPVLRDSIPGFDCRDFIFRVFDNQWPDLGLEQRVRHITKALHHFLPDDFPSAVDLLIVVARELEKRGGSHGFENMFLPEYIEVYGREHLDESLRGLQQITGCGIPRLAKTLQRDTKN